MTQWANLKVSMEMHGKYGGLTTRLPAGTIVRAEKQDIGYRITAHEPASDQVWKAFCLEGHLRDLREAKHAPYRTGLTQALEHEGEIVEVKDV